MTLIKCLNLFVLRIQIIKCVIFKVPLRVDNLWIYIFWHFIWPYKGNPKYYSGYGDALSRSIILRHKDSRDKPNAAQWCPRSLEQWLVTCLLEHPQKRDLGGPWIRKYQVRQVQLQGLPFTSLLRWSQANHLRLGSLRGKSWDDDLSASHLFERWSQESRRKG